MLHYEPNDPSGWLAVTAPGRLVVVDSRDDSLAGPLWAAVERGGATLAQAVLEVLTAGGLAATPSFALVEWRDEDASGDARFIVRGPLRVAVTTTDGEVTLTGEGVSTWSERPLTGVDGFELRVGGAAGVARLPLGSGAARMAAIARVADGAAATAEDASAVVDVPAADEETVVAPFDAAFEAAAAPETPEAPAPEPAPEPAPKPAAEAPVHTIAPPSYVTDSLPNANRAGDHDGLTVMSGDLDLGSRPRQQPAAEATIAHLGEFYLKLADGRTEPYAGTVIVGRAPSASKVSAASIPHLVTVDNDEHDISRNHVQFTLEGDTAVVTDLHSRNGTLITLPGKGQQKLRAGEPTAVIVGTLVDLGGGVTLTVGQR